MKVAILTVFPDLVQPFFTQAMVRIACERGLVEPFVIDVRDFATDRYRSVDDAPYGGGPGMVMTPEPLKAAIQHALAVLGGPAPVLLMSPQGKRLEQSRVQELAAEPRLVLVCGRYKGVDQRIIERYVTEELSLGDYVLSGGELAALVVVECVTRYLEGVLGDPESAASDSFATGLLEGPLYTRPEEFEGLRVPDVLLSGNHARIAEWRQAEAVRRTRERRPDLLANASADRAGAGGRQRRIKDKEGN
ncbi:MAG TPA: tRNA (guanosine(37)-N1)-methyltransferase TrmD [Candidatus Udaeobacter sp.]|nr:tRNA (guanosine(37)-N1)-methyltransferase TrmD [Candidatus Udaeobacter sp.]